MQLKSGSHELLECPEQRTCWWSKSTQLSIASWVPRAKSQPDFHLYTYILSNKYPLQEAEERKYMQYELSAVTTQLKANV